MHSLISNVVGPTLSLLVCATILGCGDDAERPSEVQSLRVLAVRAEMPFARPGSSVELSLLGHDASPGRMRADGTARQVTTLWIGGCNNPPGDSYSGCIPHLHHALKDLSNEDLANSTTPSVAGAELIGWGPKYVAQVPSDIIASRKVADGVVHPYGIQIVFFAHCGGVLRRVGESDGFPLGCFDPNSGAQLGPDDFEYGFYPLFVYETLANHNPGLALGGLAGKQDGPVCSTEVPCAEGYHCGSEQRCIPTVGRCKERDEDDCPSYRLAVEVPRSSVERAVLARIPDVDAMQETIWVSYYANGGSFEQDATMVNEPGAGFESSPSGQWRANLKASAEVRLWVVARDNRNGVAWAWQDVWVE